MITTKKSKLATCVQESQLFEDFDDDVTIPKHFQSLKTKTNITFEINDDDDFYKVLDFLRYTMTDKLPDEIYEYVFYHSDIDLEDFKDYHYEELKFLKMKDGRKYEQNSYDVSRYRKQDFMALCLFNNYFNLFKYMLIHSTIYFNHNSIKNLINTAIHGKCLDGIKYLFENGYDFDFYSLPFAAAAGDVECLKYIYENIKNEHKTNFDQVNGSPSHNAAYYGNLECLKYLYEQNSPMDEDLLKIVLENELNQYKSLDRGNKQYIDCFKYLLDIGRTIKLSNVKMLTEQAIRQIRKDIVEMLRNLDYKHIAKTNKYKNICVY